MIPVPDIDALRPQVRAQLSLVMPAHLVEETVDLSLHAVRQAIGTFNSVINSGSDPRITITMLGIAAPIMAAIFTRTAEFLPEFAEKRGMAVLRGTVSQ